MDKSKDPRIRALRIIESVAEGKSLKDALALSKMSTAAFHGLLRKDKELASQYTQAQYIKAEIMADELIELADSDDNPAKVRNQMAARQWYLSKINPGKYGDKLDINVTATLDIAGAIQEARNRIAQNRAEVIDVTPVQETALPAPVVETQPTPATETETDTASLDALLD